MKDQEIKVIRNHPHGYLYPIHIVNVETFDKISENFDMFVLVEEKSGDRHSC